jgi:hypothetical protein
VITTIKTRPALGSTNQTRTPPRAASSLRVPAPSSARRTRPRFVARHVHEVALLHVFPAAQPGPAQAAPIEGVLEAPFDPLGAKAERRPGDPRAQAPAVVVDRAPGVRIAVPALDVLGLRLGDPGLPRAAQDP